MAFQKGAGIGKQCKTGGMRFRKAIQRKRGDGLDNAILRLACDAVAIHSFTQLHFHFPHSFFGTLEAKGPAQILRLSAGEPGRDHSDPNQLLLE